MLQGVQKKGYSMLKLLLLICQISNPFVRNFNSPAIEEFAAAHEDTICSFASARAGLTAARRECAAEEKQLDHDISEEKARQSVLQQEIVAHNDQSDCLREQIDRICLEMREAYLLAESEIEHEEHQEKQLLREICAIEEEPEAEHASFTQLGMAL